MSHEKFKHKLLQYYYKELDGAGQKEFEAHLKDCAKCREEMESLKAIALGLDRALGNELPREEAVSRVLASAKAARPAARAENFKLQWAFSMAIGLALCLALVASWIFLSRPSRENYNFSQVAVNLESVAQDMDSLSADAQEEQGLAAGAGDINSVMVANDLSYLKEDQKLYAMDREIDEIANIANGIF